MRSALSDIGMVSMISPPVVIQTDSIILGGAGMKQPVGAMDAVGYAVGLFDGEELGLVEGDPDGL